MKDYLLAIELWWIKLLIKLKLKRTYTAEELLEELRKDDEQKES